MKNSQQHPKLRRKLIQLKSKAKKTETTKESKTKTTKSDTDGPPKRKRCQAKTVIARFEKMGVSAGRVSSCVKSAMGKGIIVLTGDV